MAATGRRADCPRFGCNCPKCPSGNPTYYPVKSDIYLLSGLGGLSDLAVPEPVWAAGHPASEAFVSTPSLKTCGV